MSLPKIVCSSPGPDTDSEKIGSATSDPRRQESLLAGGVNAKLLNFVSQPSTLDRIFRRRPMTVLWESSNGSFIVLMNEMSPVAAGFFRLYFDSEALSQEPLLICTPSRQFVIHPAIGGTTAGSSGWAPE